MNENQFVLIHLLIRILLVSGKTELSKQSEHQPCGPPPSVQNAILQYTSTQTGARVTIKCREGFSLNGPSSRTCLPNGIWDNMAPQCFPLCKVPITPSMAFIKSPKDTKLFATGEKIIFGCAKGFKSVGSPLSLMCFSGNWVKLGPFFCQANHNCPRVTKRALSLCAAECSPYVGCPDPTRQECLCDGDCGYSCIKKDLDCGFPPPVANGKGEFTDTGHNSTVRYTCDPGYVLRGASVRRCTGKGKWSHYDPTCEKLCNKPEPPVNSHLVDPKSNYSSGEKARFHCVPGYHSEGIIIKYCRAGSWIFNPSLKCKPGGCGDHKAPSHGSVYAIGYGVDSTVVFACDMGYTLKGSKTRRCLSNGKWSGAEPSCHIVDCGLPPTPEHGETVIHDTTFPNSALFLCHNGYQLSGSVKRFCLLNGQWSGTKARCVAVSCGPLASPTNGMMIGNETTFSNKITFMCHKDFILNGSRDRVCQSNGTWSGIGAICEPVNSTYSEEFSASLFGFSASTMESTSFSRTQGTFGCVFFVAFLLVFLVTVFILFPRGQKYHSESATSTPLLILYRRRSCSV